jgi:glyoxylase-like metal-dependent hydrolase (beta-lactamase superfamily II)
VSAAGAQWAVFAIRFAHREASVRGEHFYGHDPRPLDPWPISYYVWLAVSPDDAVLIDAGFTPATAARRGKRTYLRSPMDTITDLGVDPGRIRRLVLSHLHYDHVGHARDFPDAQIVVQRAELDFWRSRHAGRGEHAHLIEADDIGYVAERVAAGTARVLDGDAEIADGLSAHLVRGHSPGLQVVRVRTAAGWVVLAADAAHFYENIERDRPYAVVNHLPSMYDAFDTIRGLADGDTLVVAGHDPLVMERYAAVPGLEGLVVRVA